MRYPRATPMFPSRLQFLEYLHRYAEVNRLEVETGRDVRQLVRADGLWRATIGSGAQVEARNLVMATGIVANPRIPNLPGLAEFRGRVLHSVEYKRPGDISGKRVLVVGVGNSGGEIGGELARSGAVVTVAVRSGAHVVPREIGPFPAQYVRFVVGKLPRRMQELLIGAVQRRMERKFGPPALPRPKHHALDAIPLIGFSLVQAIRDGLVRVKLAGITSFHETGVRFSDGTEDEFDTVLFATGFDSAVQPLGALIRTDNRGFAMRGDRVTSADQPNLWFIGHNYDHTGGLTNIRHDAPLIARAIRTQRA
jgi:cation diffusion facilitator CzcD-associated flavoprotein CzcO